MGSGYSAEFEATWIVSSNFVTTSSLWKDIVTNNGLLVESENTDALVNVLEKVIEDKDLREELGNNSFENVQVFDSSIIADQYVQLYNKYSTLRW